MSAGIRNPNFFLRRMHSLLGLLPILRGRLMVTVAVHINCMVQESFGPHKKNEKVPAIFPVCLGKFLSSALSLGNPQEQQSSVKMNLAAGIAVFPSARI